MPSERLERQLRFAMEVDRLKTVARRTYLADGSRLENSAEHSWHAALMALLLGEHAPAGLDVRRVVEILLVHDLVEVDAGDTYCYDAEGARDREDRERQAADRLFGLLPPDQTAFVRDAWDEFERGTTPEARFAAAIDRLQPLLLNHRSRGRSWMAHGITRDQVLERIRPIADAAPSLWTLALEVVEDAVSQGWLRC